MLCRFDVKDRRLQALQASFLQREGQQCFIIKAQAIYFFHCTAPFLKHYGHILVKCLCNLEHQVKGEVLRSFFDAADVGTLGSDALCKLLLRQSFFQSCLRQLLHNALPCCQ